jgi:hypothetical protein
MQTVPAAPGDAFVAAVYAKGRVSEKATAGLVIQWQDAQGKWVAAPKKSCDMPKGETGDWLPLTVFFRVPQGVGKVWFGMSIYDQEPGDVAHFDDASLKRIPMAAEGKK